MSSTPQKLNLPPVDADSLQTLNQAVSGYNREQLLWSSGYLAGMAAIDISIPTVVVPVTGESTSSWTILFAGETGNSKRVAEQLAERSRLAGLDTHIQDLRDYKARGLSKLENVLFVVATHGIGEAPEGSELFFEYWLSEKAPRLEDLNYSILALGDSSYVDFCEMGKLLDEQFQKLGATSVVDRIDCDLDFEQLAGKWIESVVDTVGGLQSGSAGSAVTPIRALSAGSTYSRENKFLSEVLQNQRITGRNSSKDVRHIELDLEGSGLIYQPGDSLGVMPENPPELVENLIESLGLDGDQSVQVNDTTVALKAALTQHKEITILSKPFLDTVAADNKKLAPLLSDRNKLTDLFKSRQVIDIVGDYAKSWEAQEFVDALRALTPRLYSISSSPDANPDEAHLTVDVVHYEEYGRSHWGAASNYLTSGAEQVPVYIESNENFRLPEDSDVPVIMIGAGTGVAPFRAFVEHRRELGHNGDNWLIFGDRNFSSDFLYQIEWLRYLKEGSLKYLDLAFSRDQAEKIYVQHRILEQEQRLYAWLDRGAHIYVCGDAEYMAEDVNAALLAVLQNKGGLSEERSAEYLSELKSSGRYQRDVY
ncbi:MAG: assimilatory sulfite reductase (NADPH) flavoprotein subunit [Pseudomonadales bacterium]|nr:assimilatory sulfite reductase (NADPH) flavoprotein subunit [Pseudomonadales bacterium]